jgi:hypothetical protein
MPTEGESRWTPGRVWNEFGLVVFGPAARRDVRQRVRGLGGAGEQVQRLPGCVGSAEPACHPVWPCRAARYGASGLPAKVTRSRRRASSTEGMAIAKL